MQGTAEGLLSPGHEMQAGLEEEQKLKTEGAPVHENSCKLG